MINRGVAQLVERLTHNQQVAGSCPAPATHSPPDARLSPGISSSGPDIPPAAPGLFIREAADHARQKAILLRFVPTEYKWIVDEWAAQLSKPVADVPQPWIVRARWLTDADGKR